MANGDVQLELSGSNSMWIFKDGGAESTRIVNLINLPMTKSAAARKMTAVAKVVPAAKATHESLKQQIKKEFAKSVGLTISESEHQNDGDAGQGEHRDDSDSGTCPHPSKRQKTGGDEAQVPAPTKGQQRRAQQLDVQQCNTVNTTGLTLLSHKHNKQTH